MACIQLKVFERYHLDIDNYCIFVQPKKKDYLCKQGFFSSGYERLEGLLDFYRFKMDHFYVSFQ